MKSILADAIRSCQECGLHNSSNHCIWRGTFKEGVVLFIGEAPGVQENIQGVPFVGRAGKLLDEWIEFLGIPNDDYLIFNSVQCVPWSNKPRVRPPTEEEIKACRRWLVSVITLANPRIIVALGNTAKIALTTAGYQFVHIKHPAYYLRRSNMEDWRSDLDKLRHRINERNRHEGV